MSREKWGSSQSWGTHIVVVPAAVWPPGEKWGGYVAASRSPSGGADGVAASAAIEQFMILTLVFERAAARGPSQ